MVVCSLVNQQQMNGINAASYTLQSLMPRCVCKLEGNLLEKKSCSSSFDTQANKIVLHCNKFILVE
jgi:hypothetical protein